MGCCLSKKPCPIPLSKSPDPVKPDVSKPTKPVIELPVKPVIDLQENPAVEEAKPTIPEKVEREEAEASSVAVEKSSVRTSSCTKEEVDAILIECGKLSRSNSAAKTRRYSGSKRSFDFDQNERTRGGGEGDVEEERRKTPQRNRDRGVERANGSPRERRRRTPSRERERERGGGAGGGRRASRSPAKRSEQATNPSGTLVISSNIKFVTVPATDPSSKRVTVKRSIGEACRTAAMTNVQPRRKPLGEIDQNATKGDKKKKMIKRENEDKKLTTPQVISRSRSLRRSRDFDFSPETLLLQSSEQDMKSSYTELLLKDIKDFHGKSSNDDEEEDPFSRLPSCVTKACSIVEAVADLNSSSSDLNQFRFGSTVKKADLVEPSFEKYVTVRRGCCSLEEQESCGSNNLT